MDYLSLKAAAAEAKDRFSRRKVLEARQVSPREAVLTFGKDESLRLSIDPSRPGLFILGPLSGETAMASPFGELLSGKIKGSVLTSISMHDPGERIVFFVFQPGWPARSGEPVSMVLEVMGRHSNLAALYRGKILQPMKAVTAKKSPGRPFLAGGIWKPPPPRPGVSPEEAGAAELPDPSRPAAAESLSGKVRGLSPYTVRQVLLAASGGGKEAVREAIEAMLTSSDGRRGWLHRTGDVTRLCSFEPVIASGGGETVEAFAPFSAASAVWRNTGPGDLTTGDSERGRLAAVLDHLAERLASTLASFDLEMERCSSHGEVRRMAEALLINAPGMPPGSASVSLPDPYEPARTLLIPLNPAFSAQENADHLFTEARRLKRGAAEIPRRRADAQGELSSLTDAREALLEKGDPGPALDLIRERGTGSSKGKDTPFKAYGGPGRKHVFEGFTLLVGRSASDNAKVTFQAAGPQDLWLHARDFPGSHVVVLTEGRKVPDTVVRHAAALAAANSGARNDTAPEIMVTERKWVRKLKGGKPGQVTVERHRTVRPRQGKQG